MFLLQDDNIDFSGLDGFDPNQDGSLRIGNKCASTVAREILARLRQITPPFSSLHQCLPFPLPLGNRRWIPERLDQLSAQFSTVEDATLSRSFRASFQQTFPTKTLERTFPALVHDFSWDVLKHCFEYSDSLKFLSDEKLSVLFQHWRAALDSGSMPPARAVLSILVERPDGSTPPASGTFLASYLFKSVLLIEGEDQAASFVPLPYPREVPTRPRVAFPSVEHPSGSQYPPENCIWPSQMISEMMNLARLRLSERGYDAALSIDLFLPVELLDYDWSCGVQLPDGLDGTQAFRHRDFRLRSLNRWMSPELKENQDKLAQKHARFRDQQDCFAWIAKGHAFADQLFRDLDRVLPLNDLIAVVSLDVAPVGADIRLKWYAKAILSAAPLVAWMGRSVDPAAAELNPDLQATLEKHPFPRLENPDPACGLRRHRCADDPGRLAFNKCGFRDRLVVLFDAPLATSAGELRPRLFLEAEGGNLMAASP